MMTASTTKTKWTLTRILAVASPLILVLLWMLTPGESAFKQPVTWQRLASPGDLSAAHAALEQRCDACHVPVTGIAAAKCIVCHANNTSLLQRQPTAFHADISSCHECHMEHRGRHERPTDMDHGALARIGLRQLESNPFADTEDRLLAAQLKSWLSRQGGASTAGHDHARLSIKEAALDCASCHKNDDRHFDLFGNDCAQCHFATAWNIPEFWHPPATSTDCAQCHQAPPSHYMMHFSMVSQPVAGKHHARVDQCHLCHQTTAWPDIKDVGWYKHH